MTDSHKKVQSGSELAQIHRLICSLLSDCCPVNLLGRDLMCRLGINLLSTHKGVETVKMDGCHAATFMKYDL